MTTGYAAWQWLFILVGSTGCDRSSPKPAIVREDQEGVSIIQMASLKPCHATVERVLVKPVNTSTELLQTNVIAVNFIRLDGTRFVVVDITTNSNHVAFANRLSKGVSYQVPEELIELLDKRAP